jgi:hypothetical protein
MMRHDEERFYRTDCATGEEPRHNPTKGLDRLVLALVCCLVFALGLVAGVLLSLVMSGWGIA